MEKIPKIVLVVSAILYQIDEEGAKVPLLRRANTEDNPGVFQITLNEKVEPRELIEEAVTRGLKEELGFTINDIERIRFFGSDYYPYKEKWLVSLNFYARIKDGKEIQISSEHNEIVWIREEDVDRFLDSKEAKKRGINPKESSVMFRDQLDSLKSFFSIFHKW